MVEKQKGESEYSTGIHCLHAGIHRIYRYDPTELLGEAEAEIEARVLPRKQKIKARLMGFREYLEIGSSKNDPFFKDY